MDFSALQTFVSVARTHSFSETAERLHLTQPAVSKRIAALEAELHTALFDRIGRTVTLTEAGRALIPKARRILAEVEESRRIIANLSGKVSGRLSLATSHHVGLHRLPSVLRRYTHRYPEVELDLHFMDSETACAAVERGELELAIVTLPAAPPERLALYGIWHDPLSVVVSTEHALASKETVDLAELASSPAILPSVGTFTREIIIAAFKAASLQPKIVLETNYLETIKMMVSIGLGWSALPQTMINQDLHALSLEGLSLSRCLGTVRHRERTLSNAAAALCDLLDADADPRLRPVDG